MKVYEIARIQHRRGTSGELPQALSEGELGITTDTGEIFFGAPTHPNVSNRKSYPYQNIKVLTEFDVQRSIRGDVYYHGPLLGVQIPASPTTATSVIALWEHGQRHFANLDFSITVPSTNARLVGNLMIATHPTAPGSSAVIPLPLAQCAGVNWTYGSMDGKFSLSATDAAGADTGTTWLRFSNTTGQALVLTISGREWKTPTF